MTDETMTVVPFGRPIRDVASALAEYATLAAIEEVAEDRRRQIRDYLAATDPQIRRSLTGPGGYAHEEPHVGTVSVTTPRRKPVIVDRDAFEAWALIEYPDRSETRERVDWPTVAAAFDAHDDIREEILPILDGIPNAIRVEVYLDEKLPADLLKPRLSTVLETDDGTRVVIKATGETVPGLSAPYASKPTLRITPDPAVVARVEGEILAALHPIEIEEGADG